MAGIYIPDMEMPKCCDKCRFCCHEGDIVWEYALWCYFDNDIAITDKYIRHANCPLVAIPDHGRLIDADEQIERAWRLNLSTRELIEEMLKSAPTIISADKKESTNEHK